MRGRRAIAIASVFPLLLHACTDAPARRLSARGPGPSKARLDGIGPPPRDPGPPNRDDERVRETLFRSHGWRPEPVTMTETISEPPPEPAPSPRDYAAEVAAAIGTPSECFDAETVRTSGNELRMPVEVVVTASGRVTRAAVGGSLPAEVRACVRKRVEAVSIEPPIEGAPRSIDAELVFAIERTAPESEPVVTWRLPPGAQPPAITLPAVGAEGRPPGFVPPAHTLPAVGGP